MECSILEGTGGISIKAGKKICVIPYQPTMDKKYLEGIIKEFLKSNGHADAIEIPQSIYKKFSK